LPSRLELPGSPARDTPAASGAASVKPSACARVTDAGMPLWLIAAWKSPEAAGDTSSE
jgi:hypothetical protein